MKFSELKFESMGAMQDADAIRAIVDLGNGYEVSVIKHQQSGGGREGLYEIALLGPMYSRNIQEVEEWECALSNGHLTEEDVEKEMEFLKEKVGQ
jgi:hypothetical protein